MKKQNIFPGIILIGFGLYFFLQQTEVSILKPFYSWPSLLIIVGIAFLCQGYLAKDYESILPGTILTGFGIHFHVVEHYSLWPNHIGVFILIISLGFLLRYQKLKTGLFHGLLFLIISILLLFYDRFANWFGLLETSMKTVWNFWPVLLIGIGLFLLIFKKK